MGGGEVVDIGNGDPNICVGAPVLRIKESLVFSAEKAFRKFKQDLSLQVVEGAVQLDGAFFEETRCCPFPNVRHVALMTYFKGVFLPKQWRHGCHFWRGGGLLRSNPSHYSERRRGRMTLFYSLINL